MKLDSVYPKSGKERSPSIERIHQCWYDMVNTFKSRVWVPRHSLANIKAKVADIASRRDWNAIKSDRIEDVEEGCARGGGRCPKATQASAAKAEPGGLVVAGVAVATSCQVVLPIFGSLFLIVGTVLTVASYRGPEEGEDPEKYADRVNLTSNHRILGPCCLVVGLVMLSLGIALCVLSRRAKNHKLPFHCPIHGDFYPISPVNNNKLFDSRNSVGWCGAEADEDKEWRVGTAPQCPHSNRSSVSNTSLSHLTSPMASSTIMASQSFSGLMPGSYAVSGETFGSIRSLSVGYDVASFPHSRSPSPPSDAEEERKEAKG